MKEELDLISRFRRRLPQGNNRSRFGLDGAARIYVTVGALPFVLALEIIIFQVGNSRFLSGANVTNELETGVYLLLIAVGQMLVLVSGGFDLSVGANVALTSVTTATVMAHFYTGPSTSTNAILIGAAVAVGLGLVIGLANGLGVAVLRVNAFIVTLASASILSGLTLVVSQGSEIMGLPPKFISGLGVGTTGGMPDAYFVAIPFVLLVTVALYFMKYGRNVYALGGNPRAAFAAGVAPRRNLIATYMMCGLLTSIAGFMLTARVSAGIPLLGAEYQLASITAAVIGGVSLRGGEGGVIGALLGTAFLTMLNNGLDLMRFGTNAQLIAVGLALVFAVVLDGHRRSLRSRLWSRGSLTEIQLEPPVANATRASG
jgi:ribose/xylose/arabinose/galactoside ABC-type transport system permease subunit